MGEMRAGVTAAIAELREQFAQLPLHVYPSPCGGAHVLIDEIPLGKPFAQETTWVGFFLSNACPEDDTYPFWVRSDLSFADGRALSPPIHGANHFPSADTPGLPQRPAVMISRRQRNQSVWIQESPLLKLLSVMKWMTER